MFTLERVRNEQVLLQNTFSREHSLWQEGSLFKKLATGACLCLDRMRYIRTTAEKFNRAILLPH